MASGLLDKANIILTPTGYKAGTMYNVAPIEQPYEDFVFSRASVASRVNSSGLVEMVGRTLGSNLVQNGDFSDIGPDLVQNGTFDLGSELVTNGDFTDGLNNWFVNANATGYVSTSSDTLQYLVGHGDYAEVKQLNNSVVGKTYTGQFEVISKGTNADVFIQYGRTFIYTGSINSLDLGVHTFTVVSSHPDGFSISVRTNGIVEIDNVSVKEVPDWSLGGAATIENDALHLESATNEYSYARQDISSLAAKTYKIQLEIKNYVSGACQVGFTGSSPNLQNLNVTSDGTYTAYVSPNANGNDLEISREYGGGNFNFDVDTVVVQELDPNDYWTLQNGWSLGDDEAVFSGTVSAYRKLYQTNFITIGKTYQLSFEITSITAGSIANLEPGSPSFNTVGVKTQTFVATFDDLYLEPTTNANLTITNVIVQEVIDTNNIPRINYDSNGENGHWLLEPTSTNLVTYSEDFEDSSWTKGRTEVSPNTTISPNGSLNASTLSVVNATGGEEFLRKISSDSSAATTSIYVKKGNWRYITIRSVNINIFDFDTETFTLVGTNEVVSFEKLQNGWYRLKASSPTRNYCSVGFAGGATNVNGTNVNGSYMYIWGAQLEALPYATSYIPTLTGSQETRATETATGAGSADLINSTEGVLYAEIAALDNDQSERQISIDDGSGNNRIILRYNSTSNNINAYLFNGSVQGGEFNHTLTDITSFIKVAFKWKVNDFALWVNGVEVGSDSSGTTFSADTLNDISFDFNGLYPFYGKCKELAVFGEALSDDELEKLTSWSSFNAMATDLGYTIE